MVGHGGTHRAHELPEGILLRKFWNVLHTYFELSIPLVLLYVAGGFAFSEDQAIFAVTAIHKQLDFVE